VEAHLEHEERVRPLELFFDLVFVFAITQVTGLLSANPTWEGLLHGLLVLGALWWAWAAYAWLTNTIDPEEGIVRLAMLGAMAAMLIVSLAVPEAFGEDGVLFGVAYLIVRALHLVLYAVAGRGDPDLLRAVLMFTPSSLVGPVLIILAGFLDSPARELLWFVALAIDYAGPVAGRGRGWRVSPGHFAERHGLIVIIALGESIVALGVGATDLELTAGVVTAALLGLVIVADLWWSYFDVVAIAAERRLTEVTGAERARLARDSYTYLHLPMVAGIVLFALGLKKTLEDVGDPLTTVPALGLCGGLALYLLAHVAFRLRNVGSLNRQRLVAAALLVVLFPLATEAPALVSLALAAAITVALIAYESIRFREARGRIRATRQAPATPS
jgi:low temperature requirement protein LtrA